jgi:hypothetical protein
VLSRGHDVERSDHLHHNHIHDHQRHA